jgi:hypothetical protein
MESSNRDAPLRPNRPDVIDENFEGEAVLVNLDTGCYYALNPAASLIWDLLVEGRSAASLVASIEAEAGVVESFIAELAAEQLVADGEFDAGRAAEKLSLPATPEFQKFTDMQDLLALDPIHDIDLDADGWPVVPAS